MKIVLIGSTQYQWKFQEVKQILETEGHEVRLPAFDSHPTLDELGVCAHNREAIEWADEVRVIWDRRSVGTIFDFGMVFALRKRFRIEYFEPKTFENLMRTYENYTGLPSAH